MTTGAVAPAPLACPACRRRPTVEDTVIVCSACGSVGRYRDQVWDFVGGADYAASFGRQWSDFRHTQLDSKNGTTISRDRFELVTGWTPAELAGARVLDAGCGAGRYSEVALAWGADLTCLDLSTAAYVAAQNLGPDRRIVARGDILAPPLSPASFDRIFSIGVLQHTPEPLTAAQHLVDLLVPGGEIVIWMYNRRWYTPLHPKAWLRVVSRRLPPDRVPRFAEMLVTAFGPLARATGSIRDPRVRRVARSALPMASYWGELPLDPAQQREWSVLDTQDWLSPLHDRPQTFSGLSSALERAGAVDIDRLPAPGLTVRARRA